MEYQSNNRPISDKSWIATLLFTLFLGGIGVHRFYVGKIGTGILYILTLGFLGIGILIDLITVCCKQFRDADGNRIMQ